MGGAGWRVRCGRRQAWSGSPSASKEGPAAPPPLELLPPTIPTSLSPHPNEPRAPLPGRTFCSTYSRAGTRPLSLACPLGPLPWLLPTPLRRCPTSSGWHHRARPVEGQDDPVCDRGVHHGPPHRRHDQACARGARAAVGATRPTRRGGAARRARGWRPAGDSRQRRAGCGAGRAGPAGRGGPACHAASAACRRSLALRCSTREGRPLDLSYMWARVESV